MPKVAFSQDYPPYRKGECFDLEGPSLEYYLQIGAVHLVEEKAEEKAFDEVIEKAVLPTQEKAILKTSAPAKKKKK